MSTGRPDRVSRRPGARLRRRDAPAGTGVRRCRGSARSRRHRRPRPPRSARAGRAGARGRPWPAEIGGRAGRLPRAGVERGQAGRGPVDFGGDGGEGDAAAERRRDRVQQPVQGQQRRPVGRRRPAVGRSARPGSRPRAGTAPAGRARARPAGARAPGRSGPSSTATGPDRRAARNVRSRQPGSGRAPRRAGPGRPARAPPGRRERTVRAPRPGAAPPTGSCRACGPVVAQSMT